MDKGFNSLVFTSQTPWVSSFRLKAFASSSVVPPSCGASGCQAPFTFPRHCSFKGFWFSALRGFFYSFFLKGTAQFFIMQGYINSTAFRPCIIKNLRCVLVGKKND